MNFETGDCAGYNISSDPTTSSTTQLVIAAGGGVSVDSNVTTDQTINMTLRPEIGSTTYTNNGTGLLTLNRGITPYWGVSGHAEVTFDGNGNIEIAGGLNNRSYTTNQTLSVVKDGTGTLTLTEDNSYTGDTTVSAGTLQIGTGGATGTLGSNSDTSVAAGATLRIVRDDSSTAGYGYGYGGTLSGEGTVEIPLDSRLNFDAVQVNSDGLAFQVDGSLALRVDGMTAHIGELSGSGRLQRGGPVYSFTETARIGGRNTDSIFSGQITHDLNMQKVGTGTLTLTGNSNDYTGTTTVDGGTLEIGNGTTADGSLGSGGVSISGGAELSFNTAGSLTVGNQVSGTGNLTKAGPGTLTLAGNNSYTGTTALEAGTLRLANVSALSSTSAITMTGGTTLTKGTGGALGDTTINAPITVGNTGTTATFNLSDSGGGGVVRQLILNDGIAGDGNVTFQSTVGDNTYSTVLLSGQSTYGGSTLLTCSAIGANLFVNLGIDDALPTTTVLTLDGGAGAGSGRRTALDLNGYDQTLAGLTNVARASSRKQIVRNTAGAAAILTVNNDSDYTFSGELGSGGANFALTKDGTGTFTLSGANTYSGGTTVNGGILISNVDGGALGAAQASNTVTINNSGILKGTQNNWFAGVGTHDPASIPSLVINEGGTVQSNGRVTSIGNLTLNGGTLESNGGWPGSWYTTYYLKGDVTVGGTAPSSIVSTTGTASTNRIMLSPSGDRKFTVADATGDSGTDLTVDTVLIDGEGGSSGLLKDGPGRMTLSGSNTYTGTTTVEAGALALNNSPTGNAIRGGHTYVVNSPGTLEFNRDGGDRDIGTITISGNGTWKKSGPGTLRQTSAGSTIAMGSGGLIHIAEGTYLFGEAGVGNWSGNLAGLQVDNGAIFANRGTAAYVDAITGNGTIAVDARLILGVEDGSGTFDGIIEDDTIDVGYGSGHVGDFGITKTGSGTQTLAGANTYSGRTDVNEGVLRIAHDNALGTTAGIGLLKSTVIAGQASTSRVELTGGIATKEQFYPYMRSSDASHILSVSGHNVISSQILGWFENSGSYVNIESKGTGEGDLLELSGGIGQWIGTGLQNFRLMGDGDGDVSGIIRNSEPRFFSGADVALTKDGAGTWTLSADNTYTGGTTINDGTLLVNGSVIGPITVNSGGTLGGDGTIGGPGSLTTIAQGGMFAPGNSPGITDENGSHLTINGTLEIELGAWSADNTPVTYDQVVNVNTLTLGATSYLDVVNFNGDWETRTWYPVVQYASLFNNNHFGSINPSIFAIDYGTVTAGWISIQIPEPTSIALLSLALVCVVRRRRVR